MSVVIVMINTWSENNCLIESKDIMVHSASQFQKNSVFLKEEIFLRFFLADQLICFKINIFH